MVCPRTGSDTGVIGLGVGKDAHGQIRVGPTPSLGSGDRKGGSVYENSFEAFVEWISRSVAPQPGLVAA